MSVPFLTPQEIIERSKNYLAPLPSQQESVKGIASILSMHLAKIQAMDIGFYFDQLPQTAAFALGSTGSGKTYVIRKLCNMVQLGFGVIDGSSLSRSGYKGINLGSAIKKIVTSNPDFNNGFVIFIDEADKFFFTGHSYHDASNVQYDMLKLLDSDTYSFDAGDNETQSVDISKTLFIFGGACSKITDILRKNHGKAQSSIGFGSKLSEDVKGENDYDSLILSATAEDLVQYGMLRELSSRVNSVIPFKTLGKEDYDVLLSDAKCSSLSRFRNLLASQGLRLQISDSAKELIQAECIQRNAGARSVDTILSEHLRNAFDCVSDLSVYKIQLTAENGKITPVYKRHKTARQRHLNRYNPHNSQALKTTFMSSIEDEASIDELALAMLHYSGDVARKNLSAIYNFYGCVLRFMLVRVKSSDRHFYTLTDLAKTTKVAVSETDSAFHKLITELPPHPPGAIYDNMAYHYERFSLYCTEDITEVLAQALESVGMNLEKVMEEIHWIYNKYYVFKENKYA